MGTRSRPVPLRVHCWPYTKYHRGKAFVLCFGKVVFTTIYSSINFPPRLIRDSRDSLFFSLFNLRIFLWFSFTSPLLSLSLLLQCSGLDSVLVSINRSFFGTRSIIATKEEGGMVSIFHAGRGGRGYYYNCVVLQGGGRRVRIGVWRQLVCVMSDVKCVVCVLGMGILGILRCGGTILAVCS